MNENLHPAAETLEAYAENALEGGDRAVFESHLRTCARCQSELEEWRSLFAALDALPRFAPSRGFADRVMASVRVSSPATVSTLAWQRAARSQLTRAGQAIERVLPRTTKGWAFTTALLALPVLFIAGMLTWLYTEMAVTPAALAGFLASGAWQGARAFADAAASGVLQTDVAVWLVTQTRAFMELAGVRGLGLLAGAAAATTVMSTWILYRNLFRNPTRETSYVTYSF